MTFGEKSFKFSFLMSSTNTADLIGDTAVSSDLDDVTEAADLRLVNMSI